MLEKIMFGVTIIIFAVLAASTAFVGGSAVRGEKIAQSCDEKGWFQQMEDKYLCKKEIK